MGGVGVALAMIGVIVCPITSGDTAFRSARLVLADWFQNRSEQAVKNVWFSVFRCWQSAPSSDIWITRLYGDTSAGPTRLWP